MWSRLFLIYFFVVCGIALPAERDRPVFTIDQIPQWIEYDGYSAEVHNVNTPDGYILELHRIPYAQHQSASSTRRPVVFLMHGLMAASNSYITLGPRYSIAYNYADAGFDVWMGNARGNRLSRHHEALNPDDDEEKLKFFDFSFEEIGIDVAQMIDYVLEVTGEEKLHYIGHSQGGTVFLVLASMLPEYNEKFTSVHLMAGVGYQDYFPSRILRFLASYTDEIHAAALRLGLVEVSSSTLNLSPDLTDIAVGENLQDYLNILIAIIQYLRDVTDTGIEQDVPDMFGGAALKQIAHYGQNIRDKAFRRWDYGAVKNNEVYGTVTPPIYDLSLITANVTMHYTINDRLLDERDVLAMARDMPNTVPRKVARDDFLHADFVIALDAKELVTNYMIESMLQAENMEPTGPDGTPGSGDGDITTPNPDEPDSSNIVALSLVIKIYLCIHTLWTLL
ncbi:lipase 3-like [Achroia grisella]|uniref:lipase 3-like n=1 Tax=Achroia grisella TaxID=688607 RepID=UPI0027D2AD95|nr:lipase 3-like [Achroia grisella]